MNKLTLLFIYIIFTLSCLAQDSIYISSCRSYQDEMLTDENHEYSYYSNGQLLYSNSISHWDDTFGSSGTNTGHSNYTYDSNGAVISYSHANSNDTGAFVIDQLHHYANDANGNLLSDTTLIPEPQTVTTYVWDSNNDVIQTSHYISDSTGLTLFDHSIITRDSLGREIVKEYYQYFQNIANGWSRELTSYDSFGNIIETTYQNGPPPTWKSYYQILYSYAADGKLLAKGTRRFLTANFWATTDTLNYQYDSNSNLVFYLACNWDTNGVMLDSIQINKNYDSNSNLLFHLSCNWDASRDIEDSLLINKDYDLNGKLLQIDEEHYFLNQSVMDTLLIRTIISRDLNGLPLDSTIKNLVNGSYIITEKYTFDNTNFPAAQTVFRFSCDDNGICTDTLTRAEYSFDAQGRINTYYLFDNYDLHWHLSEDYGIYYNASGKIVGEFSDGYELGDRHHSTRNYSYDINDNLISSYYWSEGMYTYETFCDYSWIIDTSSVLQAKIYLSDTLGCQGNPVYGNILITGGHKPYNISWNDTLNIRYSKTLNPVFITDSNRVYTLTVIDSVGQQVNVPVHIEPIIYSLHLTSTTGCSGDSILIDVSPFLPQEFYFTQYHYSFNKGNFFRTFFIPDSGGEYHISYVSQCGPLIISDTIEVKQSPMLDLGASFVLCNGDSVLLNINLSDSLTWINGSHSTQFMITTPGIYWCVAYDTTGCSTKDYITAFQNSIPDPALGNDTLICLNQSIQFDPGPYYISYLWQDGSTNRYFNYSSPSADTLIVSVDAVDFYNCNRTSSVIVITDNCLGINLVTNNSILISPNPCDRFLNISLPGNSDVYKIKLMNIAGAVVYESETISDHFIIEMNYPSGVYFVSIQSDEKMFMQKVIH